MAKPVRIRTPWRQRWRQVRYQMLPFLIFVGCVSAAMWLWGRHVALPNVMGEVYAERTEVVCPMDGRLAAASAESGTLFGSDKFGTLVEKLRNGPELAALRDNRELGETIKSLETLSTELADWKPPALFEEVRKGEVVARVEQNAALASLKTLSDELAGLLKDLDATKSTILQEQAATEHLKASEARRQAMDIERLDLAIFDRQSTIDADSIELARLNKRYEAQEKLYRKGIVPELTLVNTRLRRDVIQERINGNKAAKKEAEGQLETWRERLGEYVRTEPAAIKALLEPLRGEIAKRKQQTEADATDLRRLTEKQMQVKARQTSEPTPSQTPGDEGRGVEQELTELELVTIQLDLVRNRKKANEEGLADAQQRESAWQKLLSGYQDSLAKVLRDRLEPLRASIATQISRIDEVVVQVESLLVRSPMAGTITAVHAWPGQNLQNGMPVMTIAAQEGQYILSYVRQETGIRPVKGMPVRVTGRSLPRRTAAAEIKEVGPQVESVPAHQLRDPKVPEWGLPVLISMPRLNLRPGELVDVAFKMGLPFFGGLATDVSQVTLETGPEVALSEQP